MSHSSILNLSAEISGSVPLSEDADDARLDEEAQMTQGSGYLSDDTTWLSVNSERLTCRSAGDGDGDDDDDDSGDDFDDKPNEDCDRNTRDTAQWLCKQLRRFRGCTAEQHQEAASLHREDFENGPEHHDFSVVIDKDMPGVLEADADVPLLRKDSPTLRDATRLRFEEAMHGFQSGDEEEFPFVCLDCEEQANHVVASTSFDVDSYLGFADSLAVARGGLEFSYAPNIVQNITADLHVRRRINTSGGFKTINIRDTPHFQFAKFGRSCEVAMYLAFPHLSYKGKEFHMVSYEDMQLWMDGVFFPALEKHLSSDWSQYWRSSFKQGVAACKAKRLEMNYGSSTDTQTRMTQIHETLSSDKLDQIWESIHDLCNSSSRYSKFRDTQIFLSAKGLKLPYKQLSAHECLSKFTEAFEQFVDLTYIDENAFWVDIAKDVIPDLPDSPRTFLFRRCCLERYLERNNGVAAGQKKNNEDRLYHHAFLRDACNLTTKPPTTSKRRLGGLVKSQFYGPFKNIFDAVKVFPFQNANLTDLAMHAGEFNARNNTNGLRHDHARIRAAYAGSKRRVAESIGPSARKCFSIREEHRISWKLFMEVRRLVRDEGKLSPAEMPVRPRCAWTFSTSNLCLLFRANVNKFAAAFEVIMARTDWKPSYDVSQVCTMLLLCLAKTTTAEDWHVGGLLAIESYSKEGKSKYVGLNFLNTMMRTGYCWLPRYVDWDKGVFFEPFLDQVTFRSRQYSPGPRFISDDDSVELETRLHRVGRLLSKYRSKDAQEVIVKLMVHICLRQFRWDTWRKLALQGRRPYYDYDDRNKLCMEHLIKIMPRQDFSLLGGNKTKLKEPKKLFDLLYGGLDDTPRYAHRKSPKGEPTHPRQHFHDLKFRSIARQAKEIVEDNWSSITSDLPGSAFMNLLRSELCKYHWIWPYPNKNGTLCGVEDKKRSLFSIWKEGSKWKWAGNKWQRKEPEDYPAMLNYTMTQLDDWLAKIDREAKERLKKESNKERPRKPDNRERQKRETKRLFEAFIEEKGNQSLPRRIIPTKRRHLVEDLL